jgi:hypothetical protein
MATCTLIPDLLAQPASISTSVILPPTGDVTVEVSGSRFCIVPSLFEKVEKLAWYEHRDTLHLNASPDVFEILLQYFLFNSLPDISSLPGHQLSELELFVKPLPKTESLVEHIKTGRTASKGPTSTSFFMRNLPSLILGKSRKKKQRDQDGDEVSVQEETAVQEETVRPFAISPTKSEVQPEGVPPILEPTYSTESDNTTQAQTDNAYVSDDATALTTSSPSTQAQTDNAYVSDDATALTTSSPEQREKTFEKCRRILRNMRSSTKKGQRLELPKSTHLEWCAEFDFIL